MLTTPEYTATSSSSSSHSNSDAMTPTIAAPTAFNVQQRHLKQQKATTDSVYRKFVMKLFPFLLKVKNEVKMGFRSSMISWRRGRGGIMIFM